MNKKLKLFLKILLGIIIVLLLSVIVIFVVHKIKSNNEYNELKDLGYINKYSAGDYDLNIYRIGNKNSKHKLICISGLGVHNYSIEMSFVNEQLKDAITVMQTDTTPQAVSSLSYDSLLTLWSALKPYNMNVMITRYDVAKRILALNEMKDAQAGLDFQGTGRNITPLGAKLICSPWVNANTIIGLDKNCALQMIQSGKVTLDYNKLIDKQIEKAGISVRAGFAKIFAGAIKIISLSA